MTDQNTLKAAIGAFDGAAKSPLMLTFNTDELLTLSSALSLSAAIYRDDEQSADTKAKGDLAAWHASDMEALEVRVEDALAARRRV